MDDGVAARTQRDDDESALGGIACMSWLKTDHWLPVHHTPSGCF